LKKDKREANSEFAQILKRLLDHMFSRRDWSKFLGVSQAAISQWLSDRTIPKPETLRMIIDVLSNSDHKPKELLAEFEAMTLKLAHEVSPNGERFGDSVSAYLISPLINNFMLDLKGLNSESQERILLSASQACAAEKGFLGHENYPIAKTGSRPLTGIQTSLGPVGADETFAALENKIPGFLDKITGYLTSNINEVSRKMARAFCLQALLLVRAQENTSPMILISKIIASGKLDHSQLEQIGTPDALNALFLATDHVVVQLQNPRVYVSSRVTEGDELDEAITALSGREVRYVPIENISRSCKEVDLQEVKVKDAA
jgi:hypothetical protein